MSFSSNFSSKGAQESYKNVDIRMGDVKDKSFDLYKFSGIQQGLYKSILETTQLVNLGKDFGKIEDEEEVGEKLRVAACMSKKVRRFEGNKEGQIQNNSAYFVLKYVNNSMVAYPVSDFYVMRQMASHKILNSEEAEREYKNLSRQDKLSSQLNRVTMRNILQDENQNEEEEEEENEKVEEKEKNEEKTLKESKQEDEESDEEKLEVDYGEERSTAFSNEEEDDEDLINTNFAIDDVTLLNEDNEKALKKAENEIEKLKILSNVPAEAKIIEAEKKVTDMNLIKKVKYSDLEDDSDDENEFDKNEDSDDFEELEQKYCDLAIFNPIKSPEQGVSQDGESAAEGFFDGISGSVGVSVGGVATFGGGADNPNMLKKQMKIEQAEEPKKTVVAINEKMVEEIIIRALQSSKDGLLLNEIMTVVFESFRKKIDILTRKKELIETTVRVIKMNKFCRTRRGGNDYYSLK